MKFLNIFILLFISNEVFASNLLFDDFESGDSSIIYQSLIKRKLPVKIVENEGYKNSKGLKVTYVSGVIGSERVFSRIPLSRSVVEATLSFDVKFDREFQFVRGGKLHGVGPNKPITGGKEMKPSGWSSRMMFKKEGKISTYLYIQNKTKKYGAVVESKTFKFEKDKFYRLSLYTKLNSGPNELDGEAHIYIDGKLVVKHEKLNFWKSDLNESKISKFLFSTFHGGHDPSWSPKDKDGKFRNVSAIFDNFLITEGLKIK